MTEESFQQCRKIMQRANYLRGVITERKAAVSKWTRIEDHHRRELQEAQADGAKNQIEKSMASLEKARQQFKDLMFPESNLS